MRSVCTLLLLLLAAPALATQTVTYDLDVRVDTVARRVDGRARITVTNPTATSLTELWLWRYPERFAHRSPALTDFNFYWIYPRSFNPGGMRIDALTVDGRATTTEIADHPVAGPGTLVRVQLPAPLPPGATTVVETTYSVEIPNRYGSFGCFRRACTLAGGFYPMLPALGPGGFDLSAPPMPGSYRVRVAVPRVSDVVVNGELRAIERGGALDFSPGLQRAAAIIVRDPSLRTYETVHRGVHIVLYSPSLKPVPTPKEHLLPYLPSDRAAHVIDAVKGTLDLLAELHLPLPAHDIRLVEGALRVELAQSQPGFVFVSDQVFDIFPLARFLKFHEFEVVRAVCEQLIERHILGSERLDDLGWAAQVGATFLADLYTVRAYQREEYAMEILSSAAWIPAIDRVLYAPQVPFASAYFYTLEDPDPLRDSLEQFANRRPRGKLVAAKLRDLLGDAAVQTLVRAQMAGAPLRPIAEDLSHGSLAWFFAQWLRPYPYVDYRFVDIRSERTTTGWRHVVVLEKRGDDPPVEPVDVRLRDATGKAQTKKWDGHARSGELVFETRGPIALIEIDPRGRLYERLPGSNDDLRFDDRRPPRWKFIYNNFGGLISVFPRFALDLSLDFSLERILDIKNSMRFRVYSGWPSGTTLIGASAGYTRSFGRKVTAASLDSAFGASIAASRLNPDFGKDLGFGSVAGTVLGAGVSLSYGDRVYAWDPRRALGYSGSVSTQLTILDSGIVLSQITGSTGWSQIVPVSDSHGFAFSAGLTATFGDIRVITQLLQAGGAGGLRGYAVDALPGRMRGIGRVEWRHMFVHSLDWNVLNSLYVRGIGGGLFAEGGFISSCNGYDVTSQDLAADVGYTLRLFADWFGVSQTTFNLDIAVPLVNSTRACLDGVPHQTIDAQRPIGFYFAFGPPW